MTKKTNEKLQQAVNSKAEKDANFASEQAAKVETFTEQLDALKQEASVWSEGVYKTANEHLYSILSKAYGQTLMFRSASPQAVKMFNNELAQRQIPYNKGSSLETKVIRWVFGIDTTKDKRVFKYAKTLETAKQDSIQLNGFVAWIKSQNGVENVAGAVAKEKADAKKAELEAELFEAAGSLMTAEPVSIDTAQASTGDYSSLSVALVRHTSNGNEIIAASNDNALTAFAFEKVRKVFLNQSHPSTEEETQAEKQAIKDSIRTKHLGNTATEPLQQ